MKQELNILIGSQNPIKIAATVSAFKEVFNLTAVNHYNLDVDSLVSNQPMDEVETLEGARNRARACFQVAKDVCDYSVGLEGGIFQIGNNFFTRGIVVILRKDGVESIAHSVSVPLPTKIVELIKAGNELGTAVDILTGQVNSKQKAGTIGYLTNGLIDREREIRDCTITALARFVHEELF